LDGAGDFVWAVVCDGADYVQAGIVTIGPCVRVWRVVWAVALALAVVGAARAQEFRLKVIAINDLHGNLQSPGKFSAGPGGTPAVDAGGVDALAGYIAQLKSGNPDNVVVSAGDLTGGSPLVSNLFHDEGTIEAANRMGLEIESVGNHDFDHGIAELRRYAHGGCSTVDANTCKGAAVGTPVPFEGAKFQYLAANVFDVKTGKTVFPAYAVKTYHGVKVAFIGVTLKETPEMVLAKSVEGLRFADEAETINATVRQLRGQGVESFVVLIHQGGYQKVSGARDVNACVGDMVGQPIRPIVGRLDDAVSLVISAHTHEAYVCSLPNAVGRKIPVTSASSYGRMVSDIDVTLDVKTKRVTAVKARNVVVDLTNPAVKPNAEIARIVAGYAGLTAPIVNRVVGTVAGAFTKTEATAGESSMGDLIADAELEATKTAGGAQVAFTNPGGIRAGLEAGDVTYGELFTAQPFGNNLVTMTLTGAQIKTLLEEQFKGCALGAQAGEAPAANNRIMQPSEGFSYTWSKDAPVCNKVDAGSIRIDGVVVSPAGKYRVTVNDLLAGGGEQIYVLKQGTEREVEGTDIGALTAYLAKHKAVAPVAPHRISVAP
jgi:5'-nucleotidase